MSVAELRYAEAFLAVADREPAQKSGAAVLAFSAFLDSQDAVREFLLDPTLPAKVKKELSLRLMDGDDTPLAQNFIQLLIDKGRLALLPGICAAYRSLYAEKHNAPDICVYAAQPIDNEYLIKIRNACRKRYQIPNAEIRLFIEPGLLGGLRIQVGDIRVEDTLRWRLDCLRRMLERE